MDERLLVKKDISGIVLAINVSKVDDARGLGFSAHVVVERNDELRSGEKMDGRQSFRRPTTRAKLAKSPMS